MLTILTLGKIHSIESPDSQHSSKPDITEHLPWFNNQMQIVKTDLNLKKLASYNIEFLTWTYVHPFLIFKLIIYCYLESYVNKLINFVL